MYRPQPDVVAALRALTDHLQRGEASELRLSLETALSLPKPDLTKPLLLAASWLIPERDDVLVAATCRAGCAELRRRHPGSSIEWRVPPYAAVQLGFGAGPSHTRGTPPNVVELSPETFLALLASKVTWEEATMRVSGAHANQAAAAFPLT